MRRAAAVWLLCAILAGCRQAPVPPVLPVGGDFALTDDHGRPFESSSRRGNVVLVFFGYSFCPDVCPTTLSKLGAVAKRLGADRDRVETLFISVDPKRDTPAVMRAHLSLFGVHAVGLTGTDEEISRVAKQFGAAYQIEPADSEAKYTVAHTTTLYAIDPKGQTRLLFPYEATVDEIVEGIRSIL